MPEEARKPFRSIGMRMQRFSQSLMRSYVPPSEDVPPPAPIPPVWQAATQAPLLWEPQPTPSAPINTPVPTEVPAAPTTAPNLQMSSPAAPPAPVRTPPAAPAPIQRTPESPRQLPTELPSNVIPTAGEKKLNPNLLAILAAHQAQDAARGVIREEKKTLFAASDTPVQDESGTIRRSRRSRASFDYVETSALAKGDEQQTSSAKSESAPSSSVESEAESDSDDDSQPVEQAAGPPFEISGASESPAVINRQPMPDESQSSIPAAPFASEENDVSSASTFEPAAQDAPIPSTAAPIQRAFDVVTPPTQQQAERPSVASASSTPSTPVQRAVTDTPAPAVPSTDVDTASVAPVNLPAAPESEVSDGISASSVASPAPTPASDTSQPSVIRRQPASTPSETVAPASNVTPIPSSSEADLSFDDASTRVAFEPTMPTAPSTSPSPSIQRTSTPDRSPDSTELPLASLPVSVQPARVSTPIQRTAVPDVTTSPVEPSLDDVQPSVPVASASTPIQRAAVPDTAPITNPSSPHDAEVSVPVPTPLTPEASASTPVQRSAVPNLPTTIEPTVTDVQPVAQSSPSVTAPVSPSTPIQRTPAPNTVGETVLPTETSEPASPALSNMVEPEREVPTSPVASFDVPPTPVVSDVPSAAIPPVSSPAQTSTSIQRTIAPDTAQSNDVGPAPSDLSFEVEPPASNLPHVDTPSQPDSEPSAGRGTWHTPTTIQREVAPVTSTSSQSPATSPNHTPDVSISSVPADAPSFDAASNQEPAAPSEPGTWHTPTTIQREVAPETVTRSNPPVSNPDVEPSAPPAVSEIIQRAEAPEITSSQPPVANPDVEPLVTSTPVQPSAAEVLQRAEVPVVSTPQQPITSPDVTPPTAEIIHQAEAPTAARVIQSVEAPTVINQPPPASNPGVELSVPAPTRDATEVIQRAEAPTVASPDMVSANTPTASEIIQRAEAPAATSQSANPPTIESPSTAPDAPTTPENVAPSVSVPSPVPSAAEVIQRAEAPEVANLQPSVTNPAVEPSVTSTSEPSIPELIQRAEVSEAASPAADLPTPPTAAKDIQRTEAPEIASSQPPAIRADIEPNVTQAAGPSQPTAAEVIQRAEAPTITHSQPPVSSPNAEPTVPAMPAQPTAAEIIQRAEASQPAQPTTPATFDAVQSAEDHDPAAPSGDIHEIDLFEALSAAADIPTNQPSPTINREMALPADVIQHAPEAPDTPNVIQPPVEQPVQWADEPSVPDTVIEQQDTETAVRRAVDDELLSLLHSLQAQQRSTPPVSDKSAAPPAQRQSTASFQQPIQRQEAPAPPQIQRVIEEQAPSSPERENGDQQSEVDIDRLARDVYKMLQNRLRIERERRDRL